MFGVCKYMPRKIIKNNFIYLIIFLVLIIFLHYIGILKPFENLISRGLSYPFAWIYTATQKTSSPLNNINNSFFLAQENEKLKNKIIELENNLISLQEILSQKEILDSQIEFLSQKNISSVPAKIIARGINQNQNLLTINKGLKNNFKTGMIAVVENGLVVGKLINVMPEISHLLLLNDSKSEVSASILKNNSLTGVVKGKIDLSLELEFIPKEQDLEVGDIIITSGIEEQIPSGLLIGEVGEITQDERDLFRKATIWQPVDIKNITIVNIIIP